MSFWPATCDSALRPLKHVCIVNPETLQESTDPDFEFEYIDIGSVTLESGISAREPMRFANSPSRARKPVRPGDVIVSTVRTYLKAVASIGSEAERWIVSTGFAVLRSNCKIDPLFLYRVVQSNPFVEGVVAASTGVSYPAISPSTLGSMPVPLPDLETQKAIADFLDRETARIDQLIEKKQRLVEVLDEWFLARVIDQVGGGFGLSGDAPGRAWSGWRFLALRREITLQRGVDITKDEQEEEGLYPVVSSGGVASYHDKFLCNGPGVIVGRKGSAGKLHYEERNYWPHDTVLYVKRFGRNNRKFVYYKFIALRFESFDRSSANPTLNRNLVHPEKVWWPDRQLQEKTVESLDADRDRSSNLITHVTKSINRLREYRSALITAAVTGQIDVATWGKRGTADAQLDRIQAEFDQPKPEAAE